MQLQITRRLAVPLLAGLYLWAVLGLLAGPVAAAPPTWDDLQAAYAYDAAMPLEAQSKLVTQNANVVVKSVSFRSANGERVPAMLYRPTNVPKPPVLLFLHGLGGDRSNVALIAPVVCPLGVAALSIDAQWHGDRKVPGHEVFSADLTQTVAAFEQTVIDNRRALDYAASRGDLDTDRVVLVGVSMGGIMGSITTAVEPRIKSALLIVGGGDLAELFNRSQIGVAQELRQKVGDFAALRGNLQFIEPTSFAGHIAPRPLYMLNGQDDTIIPSVCGQALYSSAQAPKSIVWYQGGTSGGHVPPIAVIVARLTSFLTATGMVAASQ